MARLGNPFQEQTMNLRLRILKPEEYAEARIQVITDTGTFGSVLEYLSPHTDHQGRRVWVPVDVVWEAE
jgi:hypothetical protein